MTDKNIAIKVQDVHKRFFLPHHKDDQIKSRFINALTKKKKGGEWQLALNGISFEVEKGDFFGVLGRNGSGKSTLLKIISEIYQPTSGKVEKHGKLVPFIELGVGFKQELTGRDNVYLNGAMLGFSRKEIDAMYDEIVEFAELENFMDQRLKNYSSGMKVRLAFSIAIRSEADILLLDEVLAVGDAAFQRKCYNYFQKLKDNKQTIILVTHSMSAVKEYCTKAILIEDGKIIESGEAARVADRYLDLFNKPEAIGLSKKVISETDTPVYISEIKTIDQDKNITNNFSAEDATITLLVTLSANSNFDNPVIGFSIKDNQDRPVVAFNTEDVDFKIDNLVKGESVEIRVVIQNILNDGTYRIATNIRKAESSIVVLRQGNLSEFTVSGRKNIYGMAHAEISVERVNDD